MHVSSCLFQLSPVLCLRYWSKIQPLNECFITNGINFFCGAPFCFQPTAVRDFQSWNFHLCHTQQFATSNWDVKFFSLKRLSRKRAGVTEKAHYQDQDSQGHRHANSCSEETILPCVCWLFHPRVMRIIAFFLCSSLLAVNLNPHPAFDL